jgi:hypothetical protein
MWINYSLRKKASQKAEQWMGRQGKEGCHKIAKYQKLHSVARYRSDWRKNTGEAMARNGKKSQMKKNME